MVRGVRPTPHLQVLDQLSLDDVLVVSEKTDVPPKRGVGRPKSLSNEALRRVLTLRESGYGYRSTARELRRAGTDVSWETVRRAVKHQGAYRSAEPPVAGFHEALRLFPFPKEGRSY